MKQASLSRDRTPRFYLKMIDNPVADFKETKNFGFFSFRKAVFQNNQHEWTQNLYGIFQYGETERQRKRETDRERDRECV